MNDLRSHFRHQVPDSGNDESVSAVPVYLQDKHRACLVVGWGLRGQSFRFTIGAQHETSMRVIDMLSLEWRDTCIDTIVPCIHVRNGKQDAETGVWRPITSALVKMLKVCGHTWQLYKLRHQDEAHVLTALLLFSFFNGRSCTLLLNELQAGIPCRQNWWCGSASKTLVMLFYVKSRSKVVLRKRKSPGTLSSFFFFKLIPNPLTGDIRLLVPTLFIPH